jgi:putative redox protein
MTEISLKNLGDFKFEAINSQGKSAILDGPAKIGGTDDGIRPMEMILMGLGGCSVFDMISILRKQRQEVESIDIKVQGERAETVPSVFTKINVIFEAKGKIDPKKLQKAADLSMEKYCSVSKMLQSSVEITFETKIVT